MSQCLPRLFPSREQSAVTLPSRESARYLSAPSGDGEQPVRPPVAAARRIVVKLGTRVLTESSGELARERVAAVTQVVASLMRGGREVVIVSSGAVGVGRRVLGFERLPNRTELRQACAAVGQARLMEAYQEGLRPAGLTCAQLLIGQHDFDLRHKTLNLRETLTALLYQGVVPVLNENDALAGGRPPGGIKGGGERAVFRDNDRLAALVAGESEADLLVLLTDVPGVFDRDPRRHADAVLLSRIDTADGLPRCTDTPGSDISRGGMGSKLEAARLAVRGGCQTVIAGGDDSETLALVTAGGDAGTWFPAGDRLAARQRWIAFASVPRGELHLDDGAVAALRHRGASLLPAGIVRIEGRFEVGDVLELVDSDGTVVGRALARLDSAETRRFCAESRRFSAAGGRSTALIRRANIVLEIRP